VTPHNFQTHAGRCLGAKVLLGETQHGLGILVGHQPERDLHKGLARNDGLGAGALPATANPVDLGGGPRPAALAFAEARFAEQGG
jgi:hypothetical protein